MIREFDERNMAKSRKVCESMAEAASTSKQVPSERERQILDMWPRFEDGEPVWFGDAVEAHHGGAITIEAIEFSRGKVCVKDAEDGDWDTSMYAMHPLKRPSPEVLDADGVEIKVGDSMYVANNGDGPYIVCDIEESIDRIELFWHRNRNEVLFIPANRLTHTRPDSWERLEEDAAKNFCEYFGFYDRPCDEGEGCPAYEQGNCAVYKAHDIIRRAKALAGVEVGE
jgi:hypothetical protein